MALTLDANKWPPIESALIGGMSTDFAAPTHAPAAQPRGRGQRRSDIGPARCCERRVESSELEKTRPPAGGDLRAA
jgi:hypothetical protein